MSTGPQFPPNADAADRALLVHAAAQPRWPDWRELDADTLGGIARTRGLDFATALLFDRLARSPEHGPALRRTWSPTQAASFPPLAVVPGAFYREYPATGADGRALRASAPADQRVERVPVRSFGSAAENGETICRWLRARPAGDGGLVLVALSKGAVDVAAALARPDAGAAFGGGRVLAWANVSGLLGGTALVDYLRARPLAMAWVRAFLWWHGYRRETFDELARGHPAAAVPPGPRATLVPVVHVLGFPLARHLSTRRARRGYRRLAPLGPNDGGGILLGDAVRWPGTILPVWGADHYLAGVDVPGLLASVQRMISPS